MAEYIEREKVLKEILSVHEREFPTASGAFDEFVTKIVPNILACIPSADVAPVRRGRWIDLILAYEKRCDWDVLIECSCCGSRYSGDRRDNYCPNCGAKMEVPNDD